MDSNNRRNWRRISAKKESGLNGSIELAGETSFSIKKYRENWYRRRLGKPKYEENRRRKTRICTRLSAARCALHARCRIVTGATLRFAPYRCRCVSKSKASSEISMIENNEGVENQSNQGIISAGASNMNIIPAGARLWQRITPA